LAYSKWGSTVSHNYLKAVIFWFPVEGGWKILTDGDLYFFVYLHSRLRSPMLSLTISITQGSFSIAVNE
jgi:hypothetical protein